jgi:hypothetical protein
MDVPAAGAAMESRREEAGRGDGMSPFKHSGSFLGPRDLTGSMQSKIRESRLRFTGHAIARIESPLLQVQTDLSKKV